MQTLRRLGLPLVALSWACLAPACGNGKPGPEELCEAYQECFDDSSSGGVTNDDFYDQCVEALEQQLEAVQGTGCEGPFEDMIECTVDNFDCNGFGSEACEDELAAFGSCDGTSGPGF